jgi:YgiT-type zinc finger domain-containing protein
MDRLQQQLFIGQKAAQNRHDPEGAGEPENSTCPVCGGHLQPNTATIPFILGYDTIVVIKDVPAEICSNCHEPFMAGKVTDRVSSLLRQLKALRSEVSVVTYSEPAMA